MSGDTPVETHEQTAELDSAETVALGELAVHDSAPTETAQETPPADAESVASTQLDIDKARKMAEVMTDGNPGWPTQTPNILHDTLQDRRSFADARAGVLSRDQLRDKLNSPDLSDQDRSRYQNQLDEQTRETWKYADRQLSPYAEYYDLNPDKFGPMPTSEFMKQAKAYESSAKQVETFAGVQRELEEVVDKYRNALESGVGLPDNASDIAMKVNQLFMHGESSKLKEFMDAHNLTGRYNDASSLLDYISEQFAPRREDFDKPVRDVMSNHLGMLKVYADLASRVVDEYSAKRQQLVESAKGGDTSASHETNSLEPSPELVAA